MSTNTNMTTMTGPTVEASQPIVTNPSPPYEMPKKSFALRKLIPQKLTSPPSYDEVYGEAYQYVPPTTTIETQVTTTTSSSPGQSYGPVVTPFVKSKKSSKPSETIVRREINWAGWQSLLPGVKSGNRSSRPKSYSWEAAALARV